MLSDGLWLALVRGVHTGATLCAFGALLAASIGVAGSASSQRRTIWVSVALAWGAAPLWLVLQAGEMAGTTDLNSALRVAPLALYGSEFGRALTLRLLLLAVVIALGISQHLVARSAALLASALACLLQIRMGHAAAPEGPWQPTMAGLHVLAVAAWIGSLPSLLAGLEVDAAQAARRFSAIGIVGVSTIAVTALVQCIELVGGLPGLLGTAYGHAVLIKGALFTVLLGFAAVNRLVLTPRLHDPAGLAQLRWSVRIEAVLGLATVMVAAWLAAQAPSAHERPVWPVPWQVSLDALDDEVLVARLYYALLGFAGGCVLMLAAACWRGLAPLRRWCGVALGLAITGVAAPGLSALLVPAYPTSFYDSPIAFTRAAVAAGAALYPQYCAACHGLRGFGDGPRVPTLPSRPLPLTGFHLLAHSDGEMFWFLANGIRDSNGKPAMPGFADRLSENDLWVLIDYVRTLAGAEPDGSKSPVHHH
jgi:putative copper export protein/mono/diheme cytochrome c family protein